MNVDGCKRCGNDEEGCIHADGLCTECWLRARIATLEAALRDVLAMTLQPKVAEAARAALSSQDGDGRGT